MPGWRIPSSMRWTADVSCNPMPLRRGRPPLVSGVTLPRIGLHVTPTQRQRLTRLALSQHVSVASVIREAIDDLIDRDAREDDDNPTDR